MYKVCRSSKRIIKRIKKTEIKQKEIAVLEKERGIWDRDTLIWCNRLVWLCEVMV